MPLDSTAEENTEPVEAPPADKRGYHLFNPTPPKLMRELTSDRPDVTETAHTLDAGHFQLEMDFVGFTYDRWNPDHDPIRKTVWDIAPFFLKLGLTNWLDAEVALQPYIISTTKDFSEGTQTREQGFGDVIPRLKINLWGNDSGKTAMALIPFFKIPTATKGVGNGAWEGGLSVPFEAELLYGFDLGVMPTMQVLRDEDDLGNHFQYGGTVVLSHAILPKLDGLVEFIGLGSTEENAEWEGLINTAIIWNVTKNWHLDCGVRIGVTAAADDIRPSVGMTWRY